MTDHNHLLLTPIANVSIEKAMQFIKGGFSFKLKSAYDVWERSFKEHRIKNKQDYEHHKTYIEQNPVRANLSPTPEQFPHSSASSRQIDPIPTHFNSAPPSYTAIGPRDFSPHSPRFPRQN